VNSVSDGPGGTGRYVGGDDAEVDDRIRSTFSVKNRESSSALSVRQFRSVHVL